MRSLELNFSTSGRCEILAGIDVLGALDDVWMPDWERAVVVGDNTVLDLFSDTLTRALSHVVERIDVVGFAPGESSKTRATKEYIEDSMLDAGLARNCCVLGMGGGVSLDLAGFVAATYMRGVSWICVPTTLVAQVDASVGGKTGVDTPRGKNLIGAFHQPQAVLINTFCLESLPQLQWKNGLAEVVKTAWIGGEDLVLELEKQAEFMSMAGNIEPDFLMRCIQIKADIVQADEHETGARAWLNFGHTVGHAVETASAFAVPHGLAVAFGMMVESRLATRLCGLDPAVPGRLEDMLSLLHVSFSAPVEFEAAAAHLGADKKNRGSKIRMSLPTAVGRMARDSDQYTIEVDEEMIREAWAR